MSQVTPSVRLEIFKAGKHTDSAGNTRTWTVSDLDKIASSYDPSFHEAPVTIGHPKENLPAYGWVKSVVREGNSLFAEIGDLVSEFSEMLKLKMFKKRSVGLYADGTMRHLAFLGAQPPAVKGLKDFAFAEDKGEPLTIDFEDSQESLFQSFKEWLVETFKTQPAKVGEHQETDVTQQEFDTQLAAEKAKTQAAEAQAADFSEKLTAEVAKVATLTADLNGIKAAAQEKELNEFCEALVKEGKLLPADKASEIAVMKSLAGQAEMDFSEGDKIVKKAPLALYQERRKAGPKLLEFGEKAVKSTSKATQPDDKLTALTKAKMAANKGMDYAEAGRLVLKENPDLNFNSDEA